MKRATLLLLGVVVAAPIFALAQDASKPYAGEQTRPIKTLSNEDIAAYLNGEGMGLAKAAELNSYPGPRHVLQLAAQLRLTGKQSAETNRIYQRMHDEATRLGRLVVGKEKELDALFAANKIDENKLAALTGEIALLQGSLRAAHLRAHLEMKRLLSAEQVKKYDELRGYQSPGKPHAPGQHNHGHGEH
jgi:Spy/CpxP family protein refolding chaperone